MLFYQKCIVTKLFKKNKQKQKKTKSRAVF